MLRRSRERGKSAGKIITHTAVRSLAHATCTGREPLLTNAQAVTITRRAHLMRLRVRYASSRPTVPPGTGDNCVLRQGKGISAYMRHNTICDAPCVHHARPRGICARQRARLPCALRRIAVRRLMENALFTSQRSIAPPDDSEPPFYLRYRTCRRPNTSVLTRTKIQTRR